MTEVANPSPYDSLDACYVYVPEETVNGERAAGPARKKRKTTHVQKTSPKKPSEAEGFPVLLQGQEPSECARARATAFEWLWRKKEEQLENVLENANAELREKILDFIVQQPDFGLPNAPIPTGLINAGLASSATGSTFDAVERRMQGIKGRELIRVRASECHNLKAALKAIIQRGTAAALNRQDEDEELVEVKGGRRLLNYDLQALYDAVNRGGGGRCVLFFQNSEALDPFIVAELVDVLGAWQDRLSFILLFEVAVSADLFQELLPQSTVRQLEGTSFTSKSASEVLDMLFCAATMGGPDDSIYLGSAASRLLLDRQTEHIASAKDFISTLKYMYMMHFFHNPLSWLCSENPACSVQQEHITLLRNVPSFSNYTAELIANGSTPQARSLQKDPKFLLKEAPILVSQTRLSLWNIQHILELLMVLNDLALKRKNLTYSMLYTKALAGELSDSAIIKELLMAVRKLSSDEMLSLLDRLADIPVLQGTTIEKQIKSVRSVHDKASAPLRSSYNDKSEVAQTSIVADKVVLKKAKVTLSGAESAYSKLVGEIEQTLVSSINDTLKNPSSLPFSEALIYNGKSAVRDAFGAAPRAAIERALSRPHDYLACSCCDIPEGSLDPSLPATSLLYQMYCESGAVINIQDLWLAFHHVVTEAQKPVPEEQAEEKEEETLALFHRALAELRYLGMIKPSRKKADHLMKLKWKGI